MRCINCCAGTMTVEKVENCAAPKISRRTVSNFLCRCKPHAPLRGKPARAGSHPWARKRAAREAARTARSFDPPSCQDIAKPCLACLAIRRLARCQISHGRTDRPAQHDPISARYNSRNMKIMNSRRFKGNGSLQPGGVADCPKFGSPPSRAATREASHPLVFHDTRQ
jgi:hypothetical protein